MSPPKAKTIARKDTLNGEVLVDKYYRLRQRDIPDVIEYLEAENKYTKAMTRHTEKFQKKLNQELLGRIKETDLDVPQKIDDYYSYWRTEVGTERLS